ncbi:MAG: hypothetical protein LBH05_07835 [Deferribacteraceae bacterium]|jgi:hypothetical protein|nr:hypothetical protein [Deferribacteraceae bacterium]
MKTLCIYIQKLLDYPPELIVIGRMNFERSNLKGEYIVVDETEIVIKGQTLNYDHKTDTEFYTVYKSSRCVISFYGDNAKDTLIRFAALQKSQKSNDLQSELNTAIYRCHNPRHLKTQDGTQWNELWQVNIVCDYSAGSSETAESIETLEINIYD